MAAEFHNTWGYVAVVAAGLVGLWGVGTASLRRPLPGAFWTAAGLAIIAMVAQVGAGLVLYAQGERPGNFHVFYGFLILFSFSFAYIYRPQLARRPALSYGLLLLFVMGLGIRAVLTFGG